MLSRTCGIVVKTGGIVNLRIIATALSYVEWSDNFLSLIQQESRSRKASTSLGEAKPKTTALRPTNALKGGAGTNETNEPREKVEDKVVDMNVLPPMLPPKLIHI